MVNGEMGEGENCERMEPVARHAPWHDATMQNTPCAVRTRQKAGSENAVSVWGRDGCSSQC